MVFYAWDECGCDVNEWVMDDLPDGLSSKQVLDLADGHVESSCDFASFDKKHGERGGVLVLEARFGRDKETRLYVCQGDPGRAKALASAELAAWMTQWDG